MNGGFIFGAKVKTGMKKVLVTGGCGFIGSHTIIELIDNGYSVVSVDNYCNSTPETVDRIEAITGVRIQNYATDLASPTSLDEVVRDHPDIEGVIHFAALKAVGESVEQPLRYYRNNLMSTLNVVQYVLDSDVKCIVFSSSCTVYGIPEKLPVSEATPLQPAASPYGQTKQVGEIIMRDGLTNSQKTGISLRYFNPAGAHPSGLIGESPSNPALNLVPVITETAIGLREEVVIFGDDYDTRDGTCIRDYIHVMDLARAHRLALESYEKGDLRGPFEVLNMGIGEGVTVLEAIKAFEASTGEQLNYRIGPRRSGDVPAVYSDYSEAARVLGWEPHFTVEDIMKTAWEWEKKRRATTTNTSM